MYIATGKLQLTDMFYLDDLDEIKTTLDENKIVCLPTDSGWCLCAKDRTALQERGFEKGTERDQLSFLVKDPDMFRQAVPDLHPRIETLLALHNKPLALYFKKPEKRVVRQVTDDYMTGLLDHLNYGVWAWRPHEGEKNFLRLEDIPGDILQKADYVSKHRPKHDFELPVLASYNKKAQLEIIRE